ncbi:MAG: hypothetical protein KGJ79_15080 [Alphaproteobacteria bacterium]|nr:hypothetical protein [Alphaproteobacteria bacterium]MDE2493987.1 hypothetical protein [Alphaproteobacteria bacterium]
MNRVLLGDNQFFGVNHMSEERARAQAMKFQKLEAIIEVIDAAYNEGINAFMCTTHERMGEVCNHVRAHAEDYRNLQFLPCMPYAHKYANAVTENGVLGALKSFLPDEGAIGTLIRGGVSVARKDVEGIAALLMDAEMKMFHDLTTPIVFLQNVMTDFILGLGMNDVFRIFADHVRRRYNAEPGFITMNLPLLLDALDFCGIENPIVCASINKVGFRMCGGISAYEDAIANRRFRPIAMSIFASGAVPLSIRIQSRPRLRSQK